MMSYKRMGTIAIVALIVMYVIVHYAKDQAPMFGLTPVVTA